MDESGILASLPSSGVDVTVPPLSKILFRPYKDRAAAEEALRTGQVEAYFVLPSTYAARGEIVLICESHPPSQQVRSAFANLIRPRLIADLPEGTKRRLLDGPGAVFYETPDGRLQRGRGDFSSFVFPMAAGVFFLISVMASAGYLLQAVTDEKENRTMEIMVTSVSAEQLVLGKAIGLTGVALSQVLVWLLVGLLALASAGQLVHALTGLAVPWGFAGLAFLFFVPSFVLEAGIMTIIGAVVTDLRQGQQIAGMVQLVFWLPFFFIGLVLSAPDSPVLVALTVFPLTSMVSVALRWGATDLPSWQLALSWCVTAATAGAVLFAAPRVFRRGMLRYGRHLDIASVLEAVRARKV